MDKQELLQQLMHMKKEYAQKCKRLQLAVRAKKSREHVRRKVQEQNKFSTDEESFQDESFNGSLSSPIGFSSEKTLDLTPSHLTPQNTGSPDIEKLQSKNSHVVNSKKQTATSENVSGNFPLQEMPGSGVLDDCNRNGEKYKSTSTENQPGQIISSAKLDKVPIGKNGYSSKCEIKDSSLPSQKLPPQNNDNQNSGSQSADSSECSALSTKPKSDDFSSHDFDLSSSPPTIRRKRKHSASYRDVLPRTTPSSVGIPCDINQKSINEKPKPRRRSYKKEEQNIILLSVMDYIVEEGKRDTSFKEFQLPDSEYAKIKAKQQNKNSTRNSRRRSENPSCQSKIKTAGTIKTFIENLDSKPRRSSRKPSDILNPSHLEKSEDFQKQLPNPAENLQNSVPECTINTNSCKSVSQNVSNSADHDDSKNIQECSLEADTPKRIPKQNIDSKTENCLVNSPQDVCHLDNFKIPKKCLPFTKTESVKNGPKLTPNHSCLEESQEFSDSLDHTHSRDSEKCLRKTVDQTARKSINNPNKDLESKTCSVDSQDLLDSVGFDESFGDKVPLFPQCNDGLSQFSVSNSSDDSIVPSNDTKIENISKRWKNTGKNGFERAEKCLPKTVDAPQKLINNRTTAPESKTCSIGSQDLLDSVGFDESFCDKVPSFPLCSDGLSQFSAENSKRLQNISPTASFSKNKDNYHLHAKESPTAIFSKNKDSHLLHAKEDSSHENGISNNDIHTLNEETILYNETILSQNLSPVRSESTQGISKENKDPKSTIRETSCDKSGNKNVTQIETKKNSLESIHHPVVSPTSKRDSNNPLPSTENISKDGDSWPEETSSPSLRVKTCVHNFPSSVCDSDKFNNETFQGFKKAESFRLPDCNEEVVSLLNSRFCPSGNNDFSPLARDLLVCVTQCSIYFWTLTKLGQWDIVHQQQITELDRCCHASLHPVQKGVGVATILVNTQGQSRLVLHTFQMQEDTEKKPLSVISQQMHKLLYSSLNSCSMAVAKISRDKTVDVCKYIFSEDLSSVENFSTVDYLSEKLLSLSAVQGLPAALLGFTATNIVLIWNHVANVLLTKISLRNILVKSCTLHSAFTEQGHIVFPLIFDEGPEQGCLLAINPNTDAAVKLLSYQRHLLPKTKSDTKMALVHHENLLSVQDNILGIWDLYSGSLLACVNSFGMTCMTLVHCDKEILLITGHKQSCLHIYRSQLQT